MHSFDQRVLNSVILRIRRSRFFRHLSKADKIFYANHLDSHFLRAAVPIPEKSASMLHKLIQQGILKVSNKTPSCLGCSQEIDASGKNLFGVIKKGSFLDCLAEEDQLEIDEQRHGGLRVEESQGFRVVVNLSNSLSLSPTLHAIGPPVQFWQLERNFPEGISQAAKSVANCIVDQIERIKTDKHHYGNQRILPQK